MNHYKKFTYLVIAIFLGLTMNVTHANSNDDESEKARLNTIKYLDERLAKAKASNLESQVSLGVELSKKTSTVKEGIQWLETAANGKSVYAMMNLMTLYQSGEKIAKDPKKAAFWKDKVEAHGAGKDFELIGNWYSNNFVLQPNAEQAFYWYEKSANAGYALGMVRLGTIYLSKRDQGNDNTTKAMQWFMKSADAGEGEAMFRLGEMYQYGCGVEPDTKQAVFWYSKATKADSQSLSPSNTYAARQLAALRDAGDKHAIAAQREKDVKAAPGKITDRILGTIFRLPP